MAANYFMLKNRSKLAVFAVGKLLKTFRLILLQAKSTRQSSGSDKTKEKCKEAKNKAGKSKCQKLLQAPSTCGQSAENPINMQIVGTIAVDNQFKNV